jgi:hypothetical protein
VGDTVDARLATQSKSIAAMTLRPVFTILFAAFAIASVFIGL